MTSVLLLVLLGAAAIGVGVFALGWWLGSRLVTHGYVAGWAVFCLALIAYAVVLVVVPQKMVPLMVMFRLYCLTLPALGGMAIGGAFGWWQRQRWHGS